MNKYKIQSKWCLWYHSINDNKWTKDSYKKIININNLLDYHFLKKNFERQHLQNGMFFIMRDDIFPTWEDPENRLGGCISFKVKSNEILDSWNKLFIYLISENIINDKNEFEEINGISIAPKKEFNIIKIWLRNDNKDYKNLIKSIEPYYKLEDSLYRKHVLEY